MLPVTNAEQTLIKEMNNFRERAIPTIEGIAEGVDLAIKVLGNNSTSELSYLCNELHIAKQLVSNLKISQEENSVWISTSSGAVTICLRDSGNNPVNAKNFMFALMSFKNEFDRIINKINHISKEPSATLYDMKSVLHKIIQDYAEAE